MAGRSRGPGPRKLMVGDVFRLMPLEDGRYGLGQIAARWGSSGGHFYFAIFATAYSPKYEPSLEDVTTEGPVLLALSLDALLHHGYWQVIGRRPIASIRWPAYKEATAPGRFDVVDALERHRRRANEHEAATLSFRSVVAPIRLQHAFEALHGVREWLPEYETLRAPAG